MIVCKEIRQVAGGFIVAMRWPYGSEPGGYGEVICQTFEDVIELLREGVVGEKKGLAPEIHIKPREIIVGAVSPPDILQGRSSLVR